MHSTPINAQQGLSRASSDARGVSAVSQTLHVFGEPLLFFHAFLVQFTTNKKG